MIGKSLEIEGNHEGLIEVPTINLLNKGERKNFTI